MKRNIFLRYLAILILTYCFLSIVFQDYLMKIIVFLLYNTLNIFYDISLTNNTIFYINNQFSIIDACLGISAYILLTFFFLSLNDKYILKPYFLSILIFTIFNFLRILILIIIHIEFGIAIFNLIHLIFYQIITGIFVGILYIFFYRYYKFSSKPVFSDIKEILK